MEAHNCKTGSAWHTWQSAGYTWAKENKDGDMERAAVQYAADRQYPGIGFSYVKRAFIEGAKLLSS